MTLNFMNTMMPVNRHSVFSRDDACVWCGSIVKGKEGLYYLMYSFWPKDQYDWGWVEDGEIGLAVSESPTGPYHDLGTILSGAGGQAWDADAVHNPCCIEFNGKYYMYYMGARRNDEKRDWFESWRNKQIGVAVADTPRGPWTRFNQPCLASEPGTWTETLVSNPAVCVRPEDGKIVMVYKGAGPVDDDFRDCLFTCGSAIADHPLGPFTKVGGPQFLVPKELWSVEDPGVWFDARDQRFYCVIKEFHGYHNRTGKQSNSLFESEDGMSWRPAPEPLAYKLEIHWDDGIIEPVKALERPFIYCEEGIPIAMATACTFQDGRRVNIQVELRR